MSKPGSRRLIPCLIAVCTFGAVVTLSAAPASAQSGSAVVFASPRGAGGDCSVVRPCTLNTAQSRARTLVQRVPRVTVFLRGGTYFLASPLQFNGTDSNNGAGEITYRPFGTETPVLDGGRQISGWSPAGNGVWRASAPGLDTRDLYVDGHRAVRARSELNPPGYTVTPTGYIAPDDSMASWHNISDMEILSNVEWRSFRCGIDHIVGRAIIMKQPCWANAQPGTTFGAQAPTWIENALELLDQPGEWYLDRPAGILYYKPLAGQDMNHTQVVAGVSEQLIVGTGTLDTPVSNLTFAGITFADTTWLGPNSPDGFVDNQASFTNNGEMPAAIEFTVAHNVAFTDDTFARLGAAGLNIQYGSQDNRVVGSVFDDLAGTGIQLGGLTADDHHPSDARRIVSGNTIKDNYIGKAGQEFFGSVGIWNGYTQDTEITHNELADLPYTGISSGWGWGTADPGGNPWVGNSGYTTPTTLARVDISNNYIHDVVQVGTDGAAIYTLSAQPGSVINGNYITDVGGDYAHTHIEGNGWTRTKWDVGIYLDDGSRYITINGNGIGRVPIAYFDKGADLRLANNYWAIRTTAVGEDQCYAAIFAYPDGIGCRRFRDFGGDNAYVGNHDLTSQSQIPDPIIRNAGLEPHYRGIARKVSVPTN